MSDREHPYQEFWSADRKFGVRVEAKGIEEVLSICAHSHEKETGGILVGKYSESLDCAHVKSISGPPSDSRSGQNWFHRGVKGLQSWLLRIWKERQYYLGEWHFHPFEKPFPSKPDIDQMKHIASSPHYHCPEPLLLVVGGNPRSEWEIATYVFPKGHQAVILHDGSPNSSNTVEADSPK